MLEEENPGIKLRAMRKAEGYTLNALCHLLDIPYATLKAYETGQRKGIPYQQLIKFTMHPEFSKYTLWLMCGTTAPEYGQVSPGNNAVN